LNRLHSIISQERELFITTGVRTKNPTGVNWFRKIMRIKGNYNGGSHVTVHNHRTLDRSLPLVYVKTHVMCHVEGVNITGQLYIILFI
jgi:hypothetical protein